MLQRWPDEGTVKPKRMSHMGDDPKHTWKQELWDVLFTVSMVQNCGVINHMHIWTGLVNLSVSPVSSSCPPESHVMSPNKPGHRFKDNKDQRTLQNGAPTYLLTYLWTCELLGPPGCCACPLTHTTVSLVLEQKERSLDKHCVDFNSFHCAPQIYECINTWMYAILISCHSWHFEPELIMFIMHFLTCDNLFIHLCDTWYHIKAKSITLSNL